MPQAFILTAQIANNLQNRLYAALPALTYEAIQEINLPRFDARWFYENEIVAFKVQALLEKLFESILTNKPYVSPFSVNRNLFDKASVESENLENATKALAMFCMANPSAWALKYKNVQITDSMTRYELKQILLDLA